MSHKNQIIQLVDEMFGGNITRENYEYIKELYEYVSNLYDGEVSEEDMTSESSSEEIDDCEKETFTYSVDQTGFYSLS